MGRNNKKCLGVDTDETMTKPAMTDIKFSPAETIKSFYRKGRLVAIHTSSKNLFVSHVLKPSMFGESARSITDNDGLYHHRRENDNDINLEAIDDSDESKTESPFTLEWPGPPPADFVMAYTRHHAPTVESVQGLLDNIVPDPASEDDVSDAETHIPSDPVSSDDSDGDGNSDGNSDSEGDDGNESDDDAQICGLDEFTYADWPDSSYGLGSETEYNTDLAQCIDNLCSVQFTDKPGFGKPLTDIDEVTHTANMIFFRRGDKHYIYDWTLTAREAMWSTLGLALAPFQHHKASEGFTPTTSPILTYFQIHLPFTPEQVRYCKGWVYMKAGSMHHVLTYSNNRAQWNYFCMDGITSDCIHVADYGTFYVHHDRTLFKYLYVTRTLKPVVIDNKRICLVRNDREQAILCASNRNTMASYGDPGMSFAMPDNDEYPQGVFSGSNYDERVIIISSPRAELFFVRGKTLCINARDAIKYQIFRDGVIIIDRLHRVYICLVNKDWDGDQFRFVSLFMIGSNTYNVSRWTSLPEPVEDIHVCERPNKVIYIRANALLYSCKFNGEPSSLEEIILVPLTVLEAVISIDLTLIERPKCKGHTISVNIETYARRCERLALLAEMFGIYNKYDISIDRKGQTVSHGPGVKKVFVQDALSQFSSTYFTQHNACTSIDLAAVDSLTAPQLFAYGRMLHLAIAMTKHQLSIRLPVILLAAVLGRELTIPELEYIVTKETPESFESIQAYSLDPQGLADCGYDTYRECLEHTVHYYGTHTDTASQQRLKEISRVIAAGIVSITPIKNRKLMNLPTLDYYMSGDYCIDRSRLKDLITCYESASIEYKDLIIEIIDTLTEEQLAILLKNWTGTSVAQNRSYLVSTSENIDFTTCSSTLRLPRSATDQSIISRETLIELLTTPINYIEN